MERLEQRRLLAADVVADGVEITPGHGVCGCARCMGIDTEVVLLNEAQVIESLKRPVYDVVVGSDVDDVGLDEGLGLSAAAGDEGDGGGTGPLSSFAGSDFDIVLNFITPGLTAEQRAAFEDAVDKWESILLGDLRDVNLSNGRFIDDLEIDVRIEPIDGPGRVLGSAGPTAVRGFNPDGGLPYLGQMRFDSADVASEIAIGRFDEIVVHEMGHVLGVGTIGTWINGTVGYESSSNPYFTGTNALTEYNRLRRTDAIGVEVEADGGPGTAYGHWDEGRFSNELMTGFINGGANPLSRFTAGFMKDAGYNDVNADAADLYTVPGASTSTSATFNRLPNISGLSATSTATGVNLVASGVSDTDGIARVEFYRESNGIAGLQSDTSNPDTLVGNDTSSSGGYTATATNLPDGVSSYYARSVDGRGAYSGLQTASANFTSDSTAPVSVSEKFEFDLAQEQATFVFSEPVVAGSGVPTLRNLNTNATSTPTILSLSGTTLVLDLTSQQQLADGNYTLTLPAGYTRDAAGNPSAAASLSFFVFRGDFNRDRTVNLADTIIFERGFGRTGATLSTGDTNYDGVVNLADSINFERNFGRSLPPIGALQATPGRGFATAGTSSPASLFSKTRLVGGEDNTDGGLLAATGLRRRIV